MIRRNHRVGTAEDAVLMEPRVVEWAENAEGTQRVGAVKYVVDDILEIIPISHKHRHRAFKYLLHTSNNDILKG